MNPQIQESVWALSEPELAQLSELIERLLDLRRSFTLSSGERILLTAEKRQSASSLPRFAASAQAPAPKVRHLARRPLREPKPGSLRGTVHMVLGQAVKPMSRAEVSASVAARRGVRCDDALTNKVGEVLRCPHDTKIKRLRHGIYSYVH